MNTPPAPLEWHPAYRDKTWLLDWLEGRSDYPTDRIRLSIPQPMRYMLYDPNAPIVPESLRERILSKHKAWGPAPYVGRPFVYFWYWAVDELGRGIAGDVRVEHTDTFASHHTFEVYHYHWDALNGHDPDTPVWP